MNTAPRLRLHRFIRETRVEGPGLRACIQVQGCAIRCPGCAVPQTWNDQGGALIDPQMLVDAILAGPKVEGVTFLGGEPFAQAKALAFIAERVRAHGMSVMTFTGHVLEELRMLKCEATDALIAASDLLIDGPYLASQQDFSRAWIGSRNQRIHFLTDRYGSADMDEKNRLEVRIAADGRLAINGLADRRKLKSLARDFDRKFRDGIAASPS